MCCSQVREVDTTDCNFDGWGLELLNTQNCRAIGGRAEYPGSPGALSFHLRNAVILTCRRAVLGVQQIFTSTDIRHQVINTDVLPVPHDGDYVGQEQFTGKSKQIGHSRV